MGRARDRARTPAAAVGASLVGILVATVVMAGGAAGPATARPGGRAAPAASAPTVTPLPLDTDVDYQLGGAAPVPAHVGIVVRDRTDAPAPDAYGVCYVNAFQTQPDQRRFWRQRHPGLLLRDGRGRPVEDSAWGEWLLDLRTARQRSRLVRIVGGWVQGCADDGYRAVELDNLDSFTRSRHLLTRREALAYAARLVEVGHDAGLAVSQKNLVGYDGTAIGFDLATAEECGRYRECGEYADHYGRAVLAIEYRRRDFRRTCRTHGDDWAVELRDRDVTPDGVRRWC